MNLDGSIDSGNFSNLLLQMDSVTNMNGLPVYLKEGLSFAWGSSLENSADSYLCFWLALLHSVSYFFFLYQSPSSSLCMVFDSISSNIDDVPMINLSANVFVFRDKHQNWQTEFGGTDRPVNSVIIFISYDLTQMVSFPTWIPDCDTHSPTLLNSFISSDVGICSTMAFPPSEKSDHVFGSVSIDFLSSSKQDAPFYCIA